MRVFCLYGVGKSTERAYHFDQSPVPKSGPLSPSSSPVMGTDGAQEESGNGANGERSSLLTKRSSISNRVSSPNASTFAGVVLNDGDGTVPLVSLGYMCVEGWQDRSRNPAGVRIVTKEYQHLEKATPTTFPHAVADDTLGAAAPAPPASPPTDKAPPQNLESLSGFRRWARQSGLEDVANHVGRTAASVAAVLYRDGVLRGGLNVLRKAGGATADHVDILLNEGACLYVCDRVHVRVLWVWVSVESKVTLLLLQS